jgi:hypothetical protein
MHTLLSAYTNKIRGIASKTMPVRDHTPWSRVWFMVYTGSWYSILKPYYYIYAIFTYLFSSFILIRLCFLLEILAFDFSDWFAFLRPLPPVHIYAGEGVV